MKNKLCIFASGTGSNAEKIIEYFEDAYDTDVALIVSNKPQAKVLELARSKKIPQYVIAHKKSFAQTNSLAEYLTEQGITHIILAGFLWLMPSSILQQYPNKIINIHPSLLPKFGGKGMYGMHVHRAVKAANELKSGITIHLVNENYDEGEQLAQVECDLHSTDTPEQIAKKVLKLEHFHFPRVIDKFLRT